MITKDYETREFTIECDGCDDFIVIDTDDNWSEMIQELKDKGWQIVKDKDGWGHYCPGCSDPGNRTGA